MSQPLISDVKPGQRFTVDGTELVFDEETADLFNRVYLQLWRNVGQEPKGDVPIVVTKVNWIFFGNMQVTHRQIYDALVAQQKNN